jgi:small subunit ribosomal protein S20
MPISASSKKSLRKSIKNRKANLFLKNKFRDLVKKFLNKPNMENMKEAQSMLDKAEKKGILHKNKVSRLKSQLSKKIDGVATKVVKKAAKKVTKKVSKKTVKKAVK